MFALSLLLIASKLKTTCAWWLLVHEHSWRRLSVYILFNLRIVPLCWLLTFNLKRISKIGLIPCLKKLFGTNLILQIDLILKEMTLMTLTLLSFLLFFFVFGQLTLLSKLLSIKYNLRLETNNTHLSYSFHLFRLWVLFVELVCFFNGLFLNNHIIKIILCFTHRLDRNWRIALMLILFIHFLLQ